MDKVKTRFFKYVKKTNHCWNWNGFKHPHGYGFFSMNGENFMAHRASWEIHKGNIPVDKLVCHSCDNRACVNPKHLWIGTHAENSRDMVCKKRYPTKLSEKQVRKIRELYIPKKFGFRKLAKLFPVDRTVIRAVITRRTWKHI